MFSAAQAHPLQELQVASNPGNKKQRTQHGEIGTPFHTRIPALRDSENNEQTDGKRAGDHQWSRPNGSQPGRRGRLFRTQNPPHALAISQGAEAEAEENSHVEGQQNRLTIYRRSGLPIEEGDKKKIE